MGYGGGVLIVVYGSGIAYGGDVWWWCIDGGVWCWCIDCGVWWWYSLWRWCIDGGGIWWWCMVVVY